MARLKFNVYVDNVHVDGNDAAQDAELLAAVLDIQTKVNKMATDLTALTAEVAEAVTVSQSAIALLQGLKTALDAAGTDPVALAALSASLDDSSAQLSAAVLANTPAAATEPAPVEPPVEPAPAVDPATGLPTA